jgi:hypothetical protein
MFFVAVERGADSGDSIFHTEVTADGESPSMTVYWMRPDPNR